MRERSKRLLGYLGTDEDIESGATRASVLRREFGATLRDVARQIARMPTRLGLRSSYWLVRYVLGMLTTPLVSGRCIRLAGAKRGSSVLVRRNQSDIYIWREIFLYGIYDYPYERIVDVAVVVDLGANSGLAGAYFQDRFPDVVLICVEPLVENTSMIRRQAADRGAAWSIEEKAIGPRRGSVTFYGSEWWSSGTMVPGVAQARHSRPNRMESSFALPPREVPTTTMDDVLAPLGGRRVSILKVDIEGAEEALLTDTHTGWLAAVDVIVMEIHDKYVSRDAVFAALIDQSFTHVPHRGPCDVFVSNMLSIPPDLLHAGA